MNLNQIVHVKLTDRGREVLHSHYETIRTGNRRLKGIEAPKADEHDLYRFYLYQVFDIFGSALSMGQRPVFENNEILTKQEAALKRIAKWVGEFPESGRIWQDGSPMSYGAAFGSNGERDYMRQLAREALEI